MTVQSPLRLAARTCTHHTRCTALKTKNRPSYCWAVTGGALYIWNMDCQGTYLGACMLGTVLEVHLRISTVVICVNELVCHRALNIRVALKLVMTQHHLGSGRCTGSGVGKAGSSFRKRTLEQKMQVRNTQG